MHRPTGVTAIAAAFFLIAAYLMGVGVVMLVSQGKLPMLGGDPLLRGLQAGGPYATLLVGAIWGAIGWGLLRLRDWARLAAMVLIISGAGFLVARVALAASHFHWWLVAGGLEILVRLVIVWYLFRTPIAEQFSKPGKVT